MEFDDIFLTLINFKFWSLIREFRNERFKLKWFYREERSMRHELTSK